MKRLWIALALLALMLGAGLLNAWYAGSITEDMTRRLSQAQALAERGDWEQAEEETRRAYADWQSHRVYLHTTMRHSDTDQILRAFRQVLEYLELREPDQYNAANADLIAQLELLAEMEQPAATNIL